MANLSEKYIAGFLDSDGSIQVVWRALDRADSDPSMRRPYLSLEWTQLTANDKVLRKIKDAVGGTITTRDETSSSALKLFGGEAVKLLSRIEKYLVVKRYYAGVVLELLGKPYKHELAVAYLKAQRKVKGSRIPNYPSRKWLAGYFDGDGTFGCRIGRGRSSGQLVAQITASKYDSEGVELLAKVFGGSLCERSPNGNPLTTWTLTMPPSKVKEFVGYFASELITKRDQAYFILGCAEMGHLRDGESISAGLKHLKAQPHRLSEPEVDVSEMLGGVKNLPNPRPEIARRVASNRQRTWDGTFA